MRRLRRARRYSSPRSLLMEGRAGRREISRSLGGSAKKLGPNQLVLTSGSLSLLSREEENWTGVPRAVGFWPSDQECFKPWRPTFGLPEGASTLPLWRWYAPLREGDQTHPRGGWLSAGSTLPASVLSGCEPDFPATAPPTRFTTPHDAPLRGRRREEISIC